jgi:hypothetical protein
VISTIALKIIVPCAVTIGPYLDRELAPVLAARKNVTARSHQAHAGMCRVIGSVNRMLRTKSLRNEHVDILPDQLVAAVSKQLLDLPVDQDDSAVAGRKHHSIRCRLHHQAELLLRSLELRSMTGQLALRILERMQKSVGFAQAGARYRQLLAVTECGGCARGDGERDRDLTRKHQAEGQSKGDCRHCCCSPQQKGSSQLLAYRCVGDAHSDAPAGKPRSRRRMQDVSSLEIGRPHYRPLIVLAHGGRQCRSRITRVISRSRHHDAVSVPHHGHPSGSELLPGKQLGQVGGEQPEAHDEPDFSVAQNGDRDVEDRAPDHQAGEQIRDHRSSGRERAPKRFRIAGQGRLLAIFDVGVHQLAAGSIGQNQVRAALQACFCLLVKACPVPFSQRLRCRQRSQNGQMAIEISIQIVDQSTENLQHAPLQLLALDRCGVPEQRSQQQ